MADSDVEMLRLRLDVVEARVGVLDGGSRPPMALGSGLTLADVAQYVRPGQTYVERAPKPWVEGGMSRSTWYRRKKEGAL